MEWTEYDTSGNTVPKEATYTDVPHTITVCCQGAGAGGQKGTLSSYAGSGGAAGGFIAANCFLGKNKKYADTDKDTITFTIQVGRGGGSDEKGESSFVQIDQIIDLTKFASEKNPTLAYYNSDCEYTELENTLKIEGEGGGT